MRTRTIIIAEAWAVWVSCEYRNLVMEQCPLVISFVSYHRYFARLCRCYNRRELSPGFSLIQMAQDVAHFIHKNTKSIEPCTDMVLKLDFTDASSSVHDYHKVLVALEIELHSVFDNDMP